MRFWVAVGFVLLTTGCSQQYLSYEGALDGGPSYTAYLISYRSDGLKLHAMVAVPASAVPENGYPVVIANHGYVPNPRKYGIAADGIDSRPGDYYRSVPELYASRGFLVVLPDYRGHNNSDGYEQIKDQNRGSIALYAADVIALMPHLGEIEHADADRVFMWSHSMGGSVSMRALLATDVIKASSFWATTDVEALSDRFGMVNGPVIIHHAKGDQSVSHSNAERLASRLSRIAHPHQFWSYDSEEHYFAGEFRELAADRDAELFLSL